MMGVKRRAFLIGGAAIVGGGVFAIHMADGRATSRAATLTAGKGEASFATWLKIGHDDTVTLYSPHIDFGQGSNTALAQMLAEELDADWSKIKVELAPSESAFANVALIKGFLGEMSGHPGLTGSLPKSLVSMMARSMNMQTTGGSSAVRFTGQNGMRVVGAAARLALVDEAAARLGVPAAELTTGNSLVTHTKSGKSLRYGELAEAAAARDLVVDPPLKAAKDYKYIGKPVPRFDVPEKVDGRAVYGIDFALPEMRVATILAAPVRGGKLTSVDPAPAMAVKGVEKVIQLDDAVVVVASGYWAAHKGLEALSPKFSDGGKGSVSSASIIAEQDKAIGAAGTAASVDAVYRVPFLHHATMEPLALTAHHKDGKLDLWGGVQDPLSAKMIAAKASGLSSDDVTFHPMIIGGGFGRRFPPYYQIIGQAAKIAMQIEHPVKLIWSREEDVKQGAYRPLVSAHVIATLGANGKIASWTNNYAQPSDAGAEAELFYTIPEIKVKHHKVETHQVDAFWRSVNASQHGFFTESAMDELAHKAGVDPFEFRRQHLAPGSRHLAVLEEVAKRAGWGTPLPKGVGRGIAIAQCFGSIVAEVVEASVGEDGTPKIHKVFAVADCGTTVNPLNAEAQVQGGIIMGLSAALGEAITLDKGAVVQSNFSDYSILKLAGAPESIDVHFIESGANMGGLGEPGLPPAAPALANALFAVTGKRIRQLPIVANA
jgi:isoquinoline 1-oxidoreductase subunit beta